ncbi:PepSY domain-containing protein [Tenacibaculum sp. SG-28]|uniref:PepSY-associated TM helix domain-containing protein n=1 Tax=Tenacibaculum sp. SG-28 TaxID=754426 RepID=UPI000CF479B8|nr:PepSY-associated TM helix domain-containing protein [Tenacibaculum sp. SG-28]PQJ21902.1 hypothetical protein BSU00_07680 [Tenacibaculum sp. SG-28]
MPKRNYNVFFNTHTVSGIIISVALYVIFFAGAFSLFREEIQIWEEGRFISHVKREHIDYDEILRNLDAKYDLLGRDMQLNFGGKSDAIYVYLGPSKDSLASEASKTPHYFYTDIITKDTKTYEEQYSLGEFLYRLHFLQQIPSIGVYLAGLISLFFLFAIITGTIVHWKKIGSNFFTFNPKSILKKLWTDAHTALGIIGLPFQFVFAVTGAYFATSVLVLIPANFLYNNNQTKLIEDLRPERKTFEWIKPSDKEVPSFNTFAKQTASEWDDFHLTRAFIKNYKGVNMKYTIIGDISDKERFVGSGNITYDAYSGRIESITNPREPNYVQDVQRTVGRLHFADFGGSFIKIIYFILALITCFVILTGVLIWVEARNKKSMQLEQRMFTAKIGHIYLAICLSMLPATALSFLFVKFGIGNFLNKQTAIYSFYFLSWFAFAIFYRCKRDNYYTNKSSLLLGAIFGFLIPISNGLVSGNWIWKTYADKQYEILTVDVLWLLIASLALLFYFKVKPSIKEKSSFNKTPISYTNTKENKKQNTLTNKKYHLPMRIKISLLWIFIAIGFIFHHVYGLANVYFQESILLDDATGETPFWAHQWRILLEGLALTFGLLSLEITKKWFVLSSFIWAIILGIFNLYHVITAVIYEPSNISEIFILILLVVASILLIKALNEWRKDSTNGDESIPS